MVWLFKRVDCAVGERGAANKPGVDCYDVTQCIFSRQECVNRVRVVGNSPDLAT